MSLRTVGIEFEARGEQKVIKALRDVGRAIEESSRKQVSAQQASRSLDAQRTRETQNLERLRNKYIQGYAAMDAYSKEMNDLAMAHRAGIINAEQQRIEVERLNAAMANGTLAVGGMSAANQFASRSMNGTGMAMQQVGYQVGDFLVQVQSGTNAFVAFGQQATQLVGILPLMGAGFLGLSTGGLIALASGLGIAIPLVTALGAAFVRTRQDANSAEDGIESFEDRLESARSSIQSTAIELERMNRGFETIAELTLDEQIRQAEQELAAAQRAMEGATIRGRAGGGPGLTQYEAQRDVEAARERFENAQRELEVLRNQNAELETRERLEELSVQMSERALQLQRDRMDALLEEGRIAEEGRETRQEMIAELQRETELQQAIAQFGERSVQVEQLRAEQARNAFLARVEETTQNQVLIDQVMAHYDAQVRASEEAARTEEILARIAGMDMPITARIRQLAAALDITAGAAARLMANLPGGSGVAGGDPTISGFEPLDPRSGLQGADTGTTGEAGQITLPPVGGGGGGGGGGGTSAFQSQIEGIRALQEAIAAAEEQAALFGQEVDLLDSALQHGLITQQEYNNLLTQAQEAYGQAQTAAYDYEAAIEQISNTASSAMEDAFMSIVDGSATAADAFRNMAREILAEAFKMLVVRPIMNSLFGGGGGGFLGGLFGGVSKNEYGNAFHAGRVIPFANGGVVSSPTMFPMRGGTGLMGEAGPEAIMPLKRGRDGKLGVQAEGGGGNVVVNNHFHFQANGDESVKRIIAQEAPKIANLTQQQIIDQRKRGGVMKATF